MPLYEYQCRSCKAHFERIRKFSDPPLTKCENCGGKLEQLLSSPAFQFKGSGWYITDYARKSDGDGGKSAPEPVAEKPSNGKGGETKNAGDTKKPPETPKATKPSPAAK